MDDKRLRQLMERYAVELMQDDLEHDCWVVVVWSKGKTEGPPEAGHGPFASAAEALVRAEELRAEMAAAPGAQTFMAGYQPTISIVPVYGDEEEGA